MLLYFYKSKFILRMLNVKLLIRERRGRYGSFFTLLYGTRRDTGATYERRMYELPARHIRLGI